MRILLPLAGVVLGVMASSCAAGAGDGEPRESTTVSAAPSSPFTVAYGSADSQFGELYVPRETGSGTKSAVVVLIHGGFWSATYGLDLTHPLALDLVARGYAVWNVEYRRVGEEGGGYPGTLDDVGVAIDQLATLADQYSLDLSRVALVGHSAGGHLAFWAAGRSVQAFTPTVAVGLGPVLDLAGGAQAGLGGGAIVELLGGMPDEQPERYRAATPAADGETPLIVVRGSADSIVPARFTVPAEGSANIQVIEIEGDNHFDLIDPTSPSWAAVLDVLPPP